MSDIFGTARGSSAALEDMQRIAQTQGQQLQNQKAGVELQEQQRMTALAQQEGQSGKSPVEQMEDMATLAMRSGFVSSGSKLAGDAATIRLKQAQTQQNDARKFQEQATAAKTQLTMVEQLLSGVKDQESWDAANSLFESMTGSKSPFAGMEYHPAIVAQLQNSTLTVKDKLDLAIKQQNANTHAAAEASAASFRDFRRGILKQQVDIARQREGRLAKVGGKAGDVGVPVKGELDHASDQISKAYPNLPQDEVNNAAYSIASRARAIRKSTPGLDADTALDRALAEANQSGEFKTLNDNYKIMGVAIPGTEKSTTHFTKSGKGPTPIPGKAIPLPANPSAANLKKGQQYQAPGGQIGTWNGSSFDIDTTDEGDEE